MSCSGFFFTLFIAQEFCIKILRRLLVVFAIAGFVDWF